MTYPNEKTLTTNTLYSSPHPRSLHMMMQMDPGNYEDVKNALRFGHLGGKRHADEEIQELVTTGKFWSRYRQHIRRHTWSNEVR